MPAASSKPPKIFISHNSQDASYAKSLVKLLLLMGVDKKDIFCSSYPGCGVNFGKSFLDAIKSQYEDNALTVLFIHSPRFYQSPVSLCEMGASWITKTNYCSFLTSDCEFDMLQGVIQPAELAFRAGQPNTYHLLNEFKGLIEKTFSLPEIDLTHWDNLRGDFINEVCPQQPAKQPDDKSH